MRSGCPGVLAPCRGCVTRSEHRERAQDRHDPRGRAPPRRPIASHGVGSWIRSSIRRAATRVIPRPHGDGSAEQLSAGWICYMQGCPERPDAPTEFSLVAGCPVSLGQRASLQRLTPGATALTRIARGPTRGPAPRSAHGFRPLPVSNSTGRGSPARPSPRLIGQDHLVPAAVNRARTAFSDWIASAIYERAEGGGRRTEEILWTEGRGTGRRAEVISFWYHFAACVMRPSKGERRWPGARWHLGHWYLHFLCPWVE